VVGTAGFVAAALSLSWVVGQGRAESLQRDAQQKEKRQGWVWVIGKRPIAQPRPRKLCVRRGPEAER